MYCPQCGTESSSGQQYCRSCGANLKVIGKAVQLSEAIARSDRGPLPKIKEMMKGLNEKAKVEQVADEISHALDQMNKEIVKSSDGPEAPQPWWAFGKKKKSARERREDQLTKGMISLFSGAGLTIFLYNLAGALVLKLPPDVIAQVPFEIDPVVRALWYVGFIPMFSGVGHLIAGMLVRQDPPKEIAYVEPQVHLDSVESPMREVPASVTDRTTNILEHQVRTPQRH